MRLPSWAALVLSVCMPSIAVHRPGTHPVLSTIRTSAADCFTPPGLRNGKWAAENAWAFGFSAPSCKLSLAAVNFQELEVSEADRLMHMIDGRWVVLMGDSNMRATYNQMLVQLSVSPGVKIITAHGDTAEYYRAVKLSPGAGDSALASHLQGVQWGDQDAFVYNEKESTHTYLSLRFSNHFQHPVFPMAMKNWSQMHDGESGAALHPAPQFVDAVNGHHHSRRQATPSSVILSPGLWHAFPLTECGTLDQLMSNLEGSSARSLFVTTGRIGWNPKLPDLWKRPVPDANAQLKTVRDCAAKRTQLAPLKHGTLDLWAITQDASIEWISCGGGYHYECASAATPGPVASTLLRFIFEFAGSD